MHPVMDNTLIPIIVSRYIIIIIIIKSILNYFSTFTMKEHKT